MNELELFGVALMPLIAALVEFAKKTFGLPTTYAPIATGILAVAGYWLASYITENPEAAGDVKFWFNALVVFLGASGIYAVTKFYGGKLRGKK